MDGSSSPLGRGAARAGVILILIGVVLLFVQLIPGISIWMLWPLFIIGGGVVEMTTPGSGGWRISQLFGGLVTVAVGSIFLANTTGYLSWGVWWQILQLWPVLLISAGLGILGKSLDQELWKVLGSVVVLVAFALAVMNTTAGSAFRFTGSSGGEPFAFSEPVGQVQDAALKLSAGVGEVRIGSGDSLISIEGESPFSAPRFSKRVVGTEATLEFDLSTDDDFVTYPGGVSARVDARLADEVVWDLDVDSGVSALEVDLSRVPVSSMKLKTGVSSNRVTLGEVPAGMAQATLSIDSGVSSIRVLVPEQAEVRFESDSGLTGHNIDRQLESQGEGIWQTSGYDQALDARSGVWTITVKSGVGTIAVDTY